MAPISRGANILSTVPEIAGFELTGSDGLVMADIDGGGHEDIVSVH